MSRRNSASIRLWLVAALFGLSVLAPTGATRERADAVHANQWQAFAESTSSIEPFVPAHLRRAPLARLVHALPRTSLSASLFQAARVVPPSFAHSLAVHDHGTAPAGASRFTWPSRAPPAA